MAAVKEKRVEDSMIEQVHKLRPTHMNGMGRLFGGQLMSWIDEVACLVGNRHSQANVITASVDNLRFIRGAYVNELIVMIAKMTYVGHTSMEVRVDTYVESMDGMRRPINRAYLTIVAVDENGKPCEVPGLIIETEAEKAEWQAGCFCLQNNDSSSCHAHLPWLLPVCPDTAYADNPLRLSEDIHF